MLYESQCYCTNIRRCESVITEYYNKQLADSGLTIVQYYLLKNLRKLGKANITHWAQWVGLERSTMVRNVKSLEKRNLVELTEGHGKTYHLTKEGEQAVESSSTAWTKAQEKIEGLIGAEDARAVLRLGSKLMKLKEAGML